MKPKWKPTNKDGRLSFVFAIKIKRFGEYSPLLAVLGALLLAGCASPPLPTPAPPSPQPDKIMPAPIISTGCGQPAPVRPGRTAERTISSGGLRRQYLLHLPPSYQVDSPTPLVLSFHGHGANANDQEGRTGLSRVADEQGFIAVYPQGLRGPTGATGWATTARRTVKVDDVLFVSDLLNQLQARLCIDPRRIFATGFSNGGGMTNVLACTMAGRLAAFAPVSGSYPPYPGGCFPVRPVPMLEIHGTEDSVVPYTGKPAMHEPPVLSWLQGWASADGCTSGPTTFYEQGDVTGMEWTGCKDDATVVHYRIAGEGHTWPPSVFVEPGAPADHTISASLLIWMFFQQHPLANPAVEQGP